MKLQYVVIFILWLSSCKHDPSFNADDGHHHTHYDLNIPPGFPSMNIPQDNPLSVEGVSLGRMLFYDNILSANNTMNCGSCHRLKDYFIDSGKKFSTGIDQISGNRNSMSLFNIGFSKSLFWDGGAADLETQVIGPITNPIELHESMENVTAKIQNHPLYPSLFKKAFGTDLVSAKLIVQAIAQFERTLISANSKFDQWKRGEAMLNAQELRGLDLFQRNDKGACGACHTFGGTFTDYTFRNTGLDSIPQDKGKALISFLKEDEGKFKTPSLRNIEMTAPYMHDGRFSSLRQCIEHYNKHFRYTENLAPELQTIPKNRMNEQEIDDLILFLQTLTDYDCIHQTNYDKP